MRRLLPALATMVLMAVLATALPAVMRAHRTHDAAPPAANPAPAATATPIPHVPADPASLLASEPAPIPARALTREPGLARAGMVIVADPETSPAGAADATPLSIEQLQTLAREEARGLVTVRHADGSESMNHEGRFRNYSVVRAGPAGTPLYQCVHGSAGVRHALQPGTRVRPTFEEE